jgi:hypothetical protein
MKRWFCILVIAACGGGGSDNDGSGSDGGGGIDASSGLACNAVTYCSTWSASSATVTPPTERGGTITDGIYRLERGTFSVALLQFVGNRVNSISDSFVNTSGTYSTTNGMISFSHMNRCDKMGTTEDTSSTNNRPYYVVDADTLQIGMADSGSTIIWYEYKRVPVDQICTANANVKCDVTNCSCSVVTNGFGTVMSGVKSCSST